jgi:hypothetical protein
MVTLKFDDEREGKQYLPLSWRTAVAAALMRG